MLCTTKHCTKALAALWGPSAGGSRVADYSTLVPPLGRQGGAAGPSAGGGVVDYITMVPPERRRTGGNRQEPSGNGERRATQSNRNGEEWRCGAVYQEYFATGLFCALY